MQIKLRPVQWFHIVRSGIAIAQAYSQSERKPLEFEELPPPRELRKVEPIDWDPDEVIKREMGPKKIPKPKPAEASVQQAEAPVYSGTSQISAAGKACIPCGNDHFSTVAGALAESIRFAKEGGVSHEEVMTRLSHAEDELNIFEREDAAPEKVIQLQADEKALMDEMVAESRKMRHMLKDIGDVESLEHAAAYAREKRADIRQKTFKLQFGKLSEEDKTKVRARAKRFIDEHLKEGADDRPGGDGDGGGEDSNVPVAE